MAQNSKYYARTQATVIDHSTGTVHYTTVLGGRQDIADSAPSPLAALCKQYGMGPQPMTAEDERRLLDIAEARGLSFEEVAHMTGWPDPTGPCTCIHPESAHWLRCGYYREG